MLPHGRTRHDSQRESWRHLPSSIFFLVLLLIVQVCGEGQSQSLLKSTRAVKLGAYVELTCEAPDEQKFDPMTVVYRFNGNVINDSRFAFIVKTGSEYVSKQKLKISQADRSHNGSYTCQPRSFRESNAAVIYVITRSPAIKIDGLLNIVLYEDSSLYLTVTVFYEANSVTLRVIRNETSQVFPGSRLDEAIFTNKTVPLKLFNVSRFDEGNFYVEGRGNLLSTDSKFRSDFVKVLIIRRPNSVRISKKSEGKGYVELSFTLEPSDPKHQYDRVIYYRVEWRGSTRNVSKPNVVIDGLDSCDEFPVAVVAVGNETESSIMSATIQKSLDSDKSIPFFRDSADGRIYAYINGRELPVCVYQNTYVCHPDFDVEIRRRKGTDTDFFLFRFNETESHKRRKPVPMQCPVVVPWCDDWHLLCPAPNATEATPVNETPKVVGVVVGVLAAIIIIIVMILIFWRWCFWCRSCFCCWYCRRKAHGQPVHSVEPNDTAASDDREGVSDGMVAETSAENKQQQRQGVTIPELGEIFDLTNQGKVPTNTETEDTLDDLYKKIDAIENALKTEEGKEDLEKVKKDLEKVKKDMEELKRPEKKELEELEKKFLALGENFLELQKRIPRTPKGPQATMVDGRNSGSDSEEVFALYNTCFGDHEKELIKELNALTPTSTFLSDLAVENLILSNHELKEDSEKLGDQLLRHFKQTVKRKKDVATIKHLFKKHYPGKELLLWIQDPPRK